ncbi:MAG: hypothetical protein AAFW87_02055 [Pseudomonadota bacterium]
MRIFRSGFISLFLAVAAHPTVADDLGFVSANGQLVLPVDIGALEGEVAIEIDAVDVTEFAQIVGDQLVVDLAGLVGPGAHEVIVYLFQGNNVSVLDSFTFDTDGDETGGVGAVGTSSSGWSAELRATHEAELRRVNGETELDGSSSGRLTFSSGDSTVTGYIGYVATSRRNEQIDRKPFNLTDYSLQYQETQGGTTLTATMGHQGLRFDPVLVDGINRRGVSFSVARSDARLRADFFALRTQDLLGAENVTGLEESDDRMFGARLAFRPMASRDLTMSFQTYSGTGVPFGGLVAGEGNGVSFGFDGTAQDSRLRYGAHVGFTRWDEDRAGPLTAESGEATWGYLSYDLVSPESSNRQLTLGVAYEAVDADYFSLANPGMPVGNQTIRVTADYSAERLFLGLLAETRKTNFGGPVTLETDRLNYAALDGTYQLNPGQTFTGRSLRFGSSVEWQDRLVTPIAGPVPLDFFARTAYVAMDLSSDKSTWSFGYTIDDFNDQSVFNQDELRQLLTLSVTHRPTSALTLSGLYNATHVDGDFGNWWTHEARFTMGYQSRRDWNLALELAATESGDPLGDSGSFVLAEASRPLGRVAELVLYGSYGDGPYALESPTDHEAVIGLLVRANTRWPN